MIRLSRVLNAQCLISERNKCRELNGKARNVKFMQILNQLMVHRISQDFHSHNTRWSRKVLFLCVDLKFLYCTIVLSMILRVTFFSRINTSLCIQNVVMQGKGRDPTLIDPSNCI